MEKDAVEAATGCLMGVAYLVIVGAAIGVFIGVIFKVSVWVAG